MTVKPQDKAFNLGVADAKAGKNANPYSAKAPAFRNAYDKGHASVKK